MEVLIPEDRPRVLLPLRDGTTVILFPLSPDDRSYLVQGLEEMSLESRFSRFGQGRQRFTEGEWDYLTVIDQVDHVAWVAVVAGQGAGVGRYIRTGGCAEVAVTVIDDFQGRGVGTALFNALLAVARADDIPELCFEVLPSNKRVLGILGAVDACITEKGGLVEARLDPRAVAEVPLETELVTAMRRFRDQPV
ncbi:MAG: GNAT family N-acetyltransferase [Actinobacteria bacterium]|nr:GNAT family N-acetyltransferase [Actinomycetota bacterium]